MPPRSRSVGAPRWLVVATAVVASTAAAGRDLELLQRVRAVLAAEELLDQCGQLVGPQRRVVATHDVDERLGHVAPASNAASRIASTVRQARTDAATSWTRTMRQPVMTP